MLSHISDALRSLSSQVRLYADEWMLCHPVKSNNDHLTLYINFKEVEKAESNSMGACRGLKSGIPEEEEIDHVPD